MIRIVFFCVISGLLGWNIAAYTLLSKQIQEMQQNNCVDDEKHEAFYSVKDGMEYCFFRQKRYPHRVKGGIVVQ